MARDPEKRRASNKAYRERNKEHYLKLKRDSHKRHKEYNNQKMRDNYKNKKEEYKIRAKDWRNKNSYKFKINAIEAYGGKCECCGESHIEFLTIDHSNNDGGEHRRQLSIEKYGTPDKHKMFGGYRFYVWLKQNSYPKDIGLRVLCWNCNSSIGLYGYCPHENKGEN